MLGPTTFRFLNETLEVPGWRLEKTAASQLWRYNLHYFDDLNALEAGGRRRWHDPAIASWIAACKPGKGDAWAPYPTSLRIVNWIKWALGGGELTSAAMYSLALQARTLRRQLEYHLLGNHLFANAKALVFAGLFFEGNEADRWLDKGLALLAREVPEQILPDGGQFERSPMYHALAFEDVLDLINVATALGDGIPPRWSGVVASWPALAQRMRAWLSAMCHPDGEITLFNDAAIGVAPPPNELARYAAALIGPLTAKAANGYLQISHLAESGYVRADGPGAALFLDVAPVGPDYLPGHAHADTLSFELSLFGHRAVVNGGTSRYDLGSVREAERGTAAHSTVTVDGQNSSEVWAGFRVARRATPFDLAIASDEHGVRVSCAHDGYQRLTGRPIHFRTWTLQPTTLRIEDDVKGDFQSAVARFHVHPSLKVTMDDSGISGCLRLPEGQEVHWRATGGAVRIEPSYYAPEFGRREPTRCLAVHFDSTGKVSMQFEW